MATDIGSTSIALKFKIVFVGNISVGKTSLLNKFTYDTFTDEYAVHL